MKMWIATYTVAPATKPVMAKAKTWPQIACTEFSRDLLPMRRQRTIATILASSEENASSAEIHTKNRKITVTSGIYCGPCMFVPLVTFITAAKVAPATIPSIATNTEHNPTHLKPWNRWPCNWSQRLARSFCDCCVIFSKPPANGPRSSRLTQRWQQFDYKSTVVSVDHRASPQKRKCSA